METLTATPVFMMALGSFVLGVLLTEVVQYFRRGRPRSSGPPAVGKVVGWLVIRVVLGLTFSVLATVSVGLYQGIGAVKRMDSGAVAARLERTLAATREVPILYARVDGKDGFYYTADVGGDEPARDPSLNVANRFVPLDTDKGDRVIHVFGGSSVVLQEYDRSFPALLEGLLNRGGGGFRVFNFGACTLDTFSVRHRAIQAMDRDRPDLVIVYTGHNDWINPYRQVIKPEFFLVWNTPILYEMFESYYLRVHLPLSNLLSDYAGEPAYWAFLEHTLEPLLNHWLQKVGLIRISRAAFAEFDRIILEAAQKNILSLLDKARSRRIPVVLVTPVGNLTLRPFGIDGKSWELYQAGMAEKRYRQRMELLQEARDEEAFTFDMRAKSSFIDWLRGLRGPGIHVMDLEQALMDNGFGFGERDFCDYVHFELDTHRLTADLIHRFLEEKKVCCGLGPRRPSGRQGD